MMEQDTVFLVDDDDALRAALSASLQRTGLRVRSYPSAEAFLADRAHDCRGCLVLDVRMPNMNGIDLQKLLAQYPFAPPVLFISGYGDVATSVGAMRNGAIDFLEKPVTPEMLLNRIREALDQNRRKADELTRRDTIRRSFQLLTARERQVTVLVTQGKTNKEISRELQISYRTVEKYRAMAMNKLGVSNLVELCRLGLDAVTMTANLPPMRGVRDADRSSATRH